MHSICSVSDWKGQLPEKDVFSFLGLLWSVIILPEIYAVREEITGIVVHLECFSISRKYSKIVWFFAFIKVFFFLWLVMGGTGKKAVIFQTGKMKWGRWDF